MSFTPEQQQIPLRPLVVAERRKLEKVTDSKESQELAKAKQDKLRLQLQLPQEAPASQLQLRV